MSAGAAYLIGLVALAAIASIRRPFVGVCSLLALEFLRPQDLHLELVPLRPVAWLAAATLLGTLLARPPGLRHLARTLAPLGAVLLVAALSAAASDLDAMAWSAWVGLAKASVLLALTVLHVDSPRRLRVVLWTIAGSIGVLAVAAIAQGVALGYPDSFQIKIGGLGGPVGLDDKGPMRDNNAFARVLVFALPLWLSLGVWSRRVFARVLASIGTTATIIAFVFTFSRGGLVALASIALLAITQIRPRRAAVAILIAGMAIGYALTPQIYQDRMAATRLDDESLNLRFGIWRQGLAMAAERPVLGVGIGTFAAHYGRVMPPPARSSHNVFVEVLAEMGVLGLLAYLWLLLAALVPLWRLGRGATDWRTPARGLTIALIGFLIASAALSHAFASHLLSGIALSLAMTSAARLSVARAEEPMSTSHGVALEGAR